MLLLDKDILKEPHLKAIEEKEADKDVTESLILLKKVIKNLPVRALG